MDMEMALNELSFHSSARNEDTARKRMSGLLDTIRAASAHGVKRNLHIDQNINLSGLELAPDYPVARWLNDGLVNRDLRSYFRSLATKISYINDLPEYIHHERQARGLGFAYQNDHLAISLSSNDSWRLSYIELEVRYLELDEFDELISELVQVKHASYPEHVAEHADWISERVASDIHSGADIWNRRDELFPHLQFCVSVGEQLKGILSGDARIEPIRKKLGELEGFCKSWRSGPFNKDAVPGTVHPESLATLDQFGDERTFRCPDGQQLLFTWHAYLTIEGWRLYFYPLAHERQLIIGYIGHHLRTIRFK